MGRPGVVLLASLMMEFTPAPESDTSRPTAQVLVDLLGIGVDQLQTKQVTSWRLQILLKSNISRLSAGRAEAHILWLAALY
jgi:hypothetical protein